MHKFIFFLLLLPLLGLAQDSLLKEVDKPEKSYYDAKPVELSLNFIPLKDGLITHIKFYKVYNDQQNYQVKFYYKGKVLAQKIYTTSHIGWHTVPLDIDLGLKENEMYSVAVMFPDGRWGATWNYFTLPKISGSLKAETRAGKYSYDGTYPNLDNQNANYYIDLLYRPFMKDTVELGCVTNVYVPKDGGWARNDSDEIFFKAMFGFFPPPVSSVWEHDIVLDSVRYRLYSGGYWRKWRINPDGSQTQIDTLHFKQ